MKRLYPLVLLFVILFGCSQRPKGRIEAAFDSYVRETYVNPNDFKGIKSIELIDSTDFYEIANKTLILGETVINQMDSIQEVFKYSLSHAPQYKVYSDKIQTLLHQHIDHITLNEFEIAAFKVAVSDLKDVLDSLSSCNRYNKGYRIKAEFKSNPEYVIFYAQDYAFVDSIKIDKNKILAEEMPDEMKRVSQYISTITSNSGSTLEHLTKMRAIVDALR